MQLAPLSHQWYGSKERLCWGPRRQHTDGVCQMLKADAQSVRKPCYGTTTAPNKLGEIVHILAHLGMLL